MAIIHTIRKKIRNGEYEFAIPHFFEEMADDDLVLPDIESAIARTGPSVAASREIHAARATKSWVPPQTGEPLPSSVESKKPGSYS